MAYKAIRPIEQYKVGDIVPDEQAEVWLYMYAVPYVERVTTPIPVQATIITPKPKEQSLDLNNDGRIDSKDASIAGKVLKTVQSQQQHKKKR
jgi:hypothetical protein